MCQRITTTQIIAILCASAIVPAGSLARTVTRLLPQPTVSARCPTWSATATAWLPVRAPPAKPPSKSAGLAAALARRRGMAGRPVACLEGAHGPGSASTPHAIWRAVCVPGLAVARTTHLFFITKTSSGGFVFPLTPFSPIGQDCTALPGVADVSCLSGECAVHRCMPGYALSHDGTHCIPAQDHISRPHVAMPGDDAACTPRQYTCKRSRK